MSNIQGPYRHGRRYRLEINHRGEGGTLRRERLYYASAEAAQKAKRRLQRELNSDLVTVEEAVARYLKSLTTHARTQAHIDRTEARLRAMFHSVLDEPVSRLTAGLAEKLYVELRGRKTRTGKAPSVTEQLNCLAQSRTFGAWAAKTGLIRTNPFSGIEAVGRRKRGRPQLTIDEARKLVAKASELADQGDRGAVAVLFVLLCGLRASEAAAILGRDIDDNKRRLWIRTSKSEAGKRSLAIPAILSRQLPDLGMSEALFANHDRHCVLRQVRRICKQAGVAAVTAQGLRGTHATLAEDAGTAPDAVAKSMGHSRHDVTERHYLAPGTTDRVRQRAVVDRLSESWGTDSNGNTPNSVH